MRGHRNEELVTRPIFGLRRKGKLAQVMSMGEREKAWEESNQMRWTTKTYRSAVTGDHLHLAKAKLRKAKKTPIKAEFSAGKVQPRRLQTQYSTSSISSSSSWCNMSSRGPDPPT